MKEAGLKPGPVSYCTLIYAFSIRHMVEEAEELVVEISRLMSIPKLCETVLIDAFADTANVQGAMSYVTYVAAMRKAGITGNSVIPSSRIYTSKKIE
ncbi:hypothetical protein F2Q69_00004123 [Brassica cretica]|nr:hypothetical protein F2Q69_00004123 [Brassica cretica]